MTLPVLVGLICATDALLYVLAPLAYPEAFGIGQEAGREEARAGAATGAALARLRDDLFTRIVDLDFDHALGKTDEEEYHQERADLKRQALATMRLLDEWTEAAAPAVPGTADEATDEVERQVRALRRTRQERVAVPAAAPVDGGPRVGR